MTRYIRISTLDRAAVSLALASGRTLKHNDGTGGRGQHHVALADGAHGAVDDPDPDLFVGELFQGAFTASAEPCTSALTMIFRSFSSPCWIWENEMRPGVDLFGLVGTGGILFHAYAAPPSSGHALVVHGMEVVAGAGTSPMR